MSYLAARGANLVVVVRPSWDPENLRTEYHRADVGILPELDLASPARVIDFRIGARHVPLLYLTPSPIIDEIIAADHIRTFDVAN